MRIFREACARNKNENLAESEDFEVLLHNTPKEKELESREVEACSSIKGGINEKSLLKLKDDGSIIFKPAEGEDNDYGDDCYRKERAAYVVDRFLSFELIPPTVIREVEGRVGSAQEFIDNAPAYSAADPERRFEANNSNERIGLYILDYIIYNWDRGSGNWLVGDDRIYAIDHGYTFSDIVSRSTHTIRTDPVSVPSVFMEKIENLLSSEKKLLALRDRLLKLLSRDEVDACIARMNFIRDQIIEQGSIPAGEPLPFNPKGWVRN
jgi:hypothetical protein